jgi:ABC-2 type transport system ATP-binding protein
MMESVVSTRHLGKIIGSRTILRDINVAVPQGDVVGIIGKNGAGKTTLLDILLGFSPATTGSAAVFGSDSFSLPPSVKRRIGFVPQQDELLDQLTGTQQLTLNESLHSHWNQALIDRLVKEWQVPVTRVARQLSLGERQKLSTLLALGHEPDLLVLDEPASSLDPVARRQFLQQILTMTASPTRTILFSTHIVSDLERVATQIWIVSDGAVVWQGALDSLKESVVRLNIHGRQALPASLDIPDAVSVRTDGTRATVVVSRWDGARQAELAQRLDAEVMVENLGLEDIFVELHS